MNGHKDLKLADHYSKIDGGCIVMKDKSQVPLAVRKKDEFLQLIENR